MIYLLCAALGTLGFGLIFNANKNKLVYIMFGGFINYLSYIVILNLTNNVFLAAASCAIVTSLYSQISAIILKCPSTIFILTGLIPIVPGSSLFYTMQNLVLGNSKDALNNGIITIEIILGIVSGMLFSSVLSTMINIKLKKKSN